MRQILYASHSSAPGNRDILPQILEEARHANALDGVTGLLWADGHRFLQVIEGSDAAIEDVWSRIRRDRRHERIELIHDRPVDAREFGDWSMQMGEELEPDSNLLTRIRDALSRASAEVHHAFNSLLPHAGA